MGLVVATKRTAWRLWALDMSLVLGLTATGCEAYFEALHSYEGPPTLPSVSAGGAHTCVVRIDGTLACWGDASFGQAAPPTGTFAAVSAGYDHTCGIQRDGARARLAVELPPGRTNEPFSRLVR